MNNRVVITGIGTVSPYGYGTNLLWQNLQAGISAAKEITDFDASELPVRFWANVPLTDAELQSKLTNRKTGKLLTRSAKMSLIAAQEAVAQSGIEFSKYNPYRVGVSIGAGGNGATDRQDTPADFRNMKKLLQRIPSDIKEADFWKKTADTMHPLLPVKNIPNSVAAHLSILYGAQGVSQTLTTACTSSSQAIGEAFHKIKHGICDVMLTGGTDSVANPNGLISFSLLGVLSKRNDDISAASRPFDRDRDGFLLGEGATILILESYESCRKRGGQILAEIKGYGCTSDAYRITDEPEDARGAIAAISAALTEAKLNPADLNYVNAHGTSTRMNDATETFALKKSLGEAAYQIPVSSNKSMFGHLVAGSGAIELAASVLSLQNQVIPPTINLYNPDADCDLDYVSQVARRAKLTNILSNSFGFGGQNSCLIIGK